MTRSFRRMPFSAEPRPELSLICICCVIGLIIGRLADGAVAASGHEALRTYLQQYAVDTSQASLTAVTVVSAAMTYLRCPTLLFLLGCTSVGLLLIPVVCFAESFFLSFAVSGFGSALGRAGVALAFSAFGIRCLITLPCIFMMALWAMDSSRGLRKGHTRRRKIAPIYYMRFAVCLLILLLGMAAELAVMPRLLQAALGKII